MSYDFDKKKYVGYIYKITNNINNMVYIGQTRVNIPTRWSQHKYCVNHNKYCKYYIYKAMKKYSIDNFRISELVSIQRNSLEELCVDLNELEIFYIKKYNALSPNGYNMTIGGDNPSGRIYRSVCAYNANGDLIYEFDSIKMAADMLSHAKGGHHGISDCCNGKSDSALGYIWRYSDEPFDKYPVRIDQRKLDLWSNYTPVDKYTLNGEFLDTFDTITDALLSIGKTDGGTLISLCCRGKHNKAYDYVWRYRGESFDKYEETHKDWTPVDVYDLNGKMISSYCSINEACRQLGVSVCHANIIYVLDGLMKSSGGYIWRRKGESLYKYGDPFQRKKKEHHRVLQCDLDGNIIKAHRSAMSAAKSLGIKGGSHILNICSGKLKTNEAYGFIWRFEEAEMRNEVKGYGKEVY